ncbi:hypothetical protein [Humidesulfovibrio idahonensis]
MSTSTRKPTAAPAKKKTTTAPKTAQKAAPKKAVAKATANVPAKAVAAKVPATKTTAKVPAKVAAKVAPKRGQNSREAMLARVESVRLSQRTEGHFDCFGRADQGYCDQGECAYHAECMSVSGLLHSV